MEPTPEQIIRIKELLPTTLGSDELRARYSADILRRSFFSAKTAAASYLRTLQGTCADFADGKINLAEARTSLMQALAQYGLSPQDGGGIQNLAGARRLDLILRTQKQMAASVANINAHNEETLWLYPAWELKRFGSRQAPRQDWAERWKAAGDACEWKGALADRMIALVGSPIWEQLGKGAGGFRDTLGNPYPPFAFSSGMAWQEVKREKCVELGLIGEKETVKATDVSLEPDGDTVAETAARLDISVEELS